MACCCHCLLLYLIAHGVIILLELKVPLSLMQAAAATRITAMLLTSRCRCFDDDARPGSHGRDVDEYVSANKVKIGKNQLLLSPIVCIVIAIATRF